MEDKKKAELSLLSPSPKVGKRHLTISVPSDLIEELKARGVNISQLVYELVQQWLGIDISMDPEVKKAKEELEEAQRKYFEALERRRKELADKILLKRLEPWINFYRKQEAIKWGNKPEMKEKWLQSACSKLGMSREELLRYLETVK